MTRTVLLLLAFFWVTSSDPLRAQPPKGPKLGSCRGLGGLPQWRVTLDLTGKTVLLVVDATKVDDCTVYYDLELTVEFLDGRGQSLGTQRFKSSDTYTGPAVWRLQFQHGFPGSSRIRGLTLNSKKRVLGVLPGPRAERPDVELMQTIEVLRRQLETESDSPPSWSSFSRPDLVELLSPTSGQPTCSSSFGAAHDSEGCAKLARATTEALEQQRYKQYGDAARPQVK
jgi:hypothetical protein